MPCFDFRCLPGLMQCSSSISRYSRALTLSLTVICSSSCNSCSSSWKVQITIGVMLYNALATLNHYFCSLSYWLIVQHLFTLNPPFLVGTCYIIPALLLLGSVPFHSHLVINSICTLHLQHTVNWCLYMIGFQSNWIKQFQCWMHFNTWCKAGHSFSWLWLQSESCYFVIVAEYFH